MIVELLIVAVAAFVGSCFQAVTGFAMGMMLMAVAAAVSDVSVAVLAAVVSLLSLVNVALAIAGDLRQISLRLFGWLALGQVPAIVIGVLLLGALSRYALTALELLLGSFIVLGSLSMMIRPLPRSRLSTRGATFLAGFAGGMVGGLFSASGPVLGWFNYRQPLPVGVIRATLLACFALTTGFRTAVVGATGGLTREVWLLVAVGLPVVIGGTLCGRLLAPRLDAVALRRVAFGVLVTMGVWIVVRSLLALAS